MVGIKMTGIYFSGTGNSRYAAERFCREFDMDTPVISIEDEAVVPAMNFREWMEFWLNGGEDFFYGYQYD